MRAVLARLFAGGRPPFAIIGSGQFLFVVFGWIFHSLRDDDFLSHFFIHGRHIVVPGTIMESPHNCFLLAFGNADNPALGAAIMADRS